MLIGFKMAAGELWGKLGPEVSLPAIALVLGTGVVASLLRDRRLEREAGAARRPPDASPGGRRVPGGSVWAMSRAYLMVLSRRGPLLHGARRRAADPAPTRMMRTCLFEWTEDLLSFLHCVAMTYIWRATEMWVNDA